MLEKALEELQGLPLSYSLSGLEMTDNKSWFFDLLDCLYTFKNLSPVENSVLYTNASGFSHTESGHAMIEKVSAFGLDWLEISRHHFDEQINQKIMRFRPDLTISQNTTFSSVVRSLKESVEVKLVCIIQEGGVDSVASLVDYIDWARSIGMRKVIFREFSILDTSYKNNKTFSYIGSSRVSVIELFSQLLKNKEIAPKMQWKYLTKGYYFTNVIGCYDDMELIFEVSDYSEMHKKHDSESVYKLVFHANGNLCADWNPSKHVLYRSNKEEAKLW